MLLQYIYKLLYREIWGRRSGPVSCIEFPCLEKLSLVKCLEGCWEFILSKFFPFPAVWQEGMALSLWALSVEWRYESVVPPRLTEGKRSPTQMCSSAQRRTANAGRLAVRGKWPTSSQGNESKDHSVILIGNIFIMMSSWKQIRKVKILFFSGIASQVWADDAFLQDGLEGGGHRCSHQPLLGYEQGAFWLANWQGEIASLDLQSVTKSYWLRAYCHLNYN